VVNDNTVKPELVDLLADFLEEWPSKHDNFSEWETATNEAKVIVKYVIKWTKFEPDIFLAGEILSAFRQLPSGTEINEGNIESIKRKIKDILNKDDSNLSNKLQGWVDGIKNNSIKEAVNEIYNSSNSVDIRGKHEQKSEDINKLRFISLGEQGKYFINPFYKENPVLKTFIESFHTKEDNSNLFSKLLLLLLCLVYLGQNILQYCTPHQQSTIAKLCDEYKNNYISCDNESWNKEIAKNNNKIRADIGKTLKDNQVYVIAVVVPDENAQPFITKNMLQGVADQQATFNKESELSKILIVIAKESKNGQNNENKEIPTGGVLRARELVSQPRILGVIGPYSSPSLVYVIKEYCDSHLPLVSPTANIPIEDLLKKFKDNFPEKGDLNKDCFFRITGTNHDAVRKILDYLNKNHRKLLILKDEHDAFADSFFEDLNYQIKEDHKLSVVPMANNNSIPLSDKKQVIEKINQWKKTPELVPDKTAILMIKGPKNNRSDNEITKTVIQTNKGKFLIIGTNPTYQEDLLGDLKYWGSKEFAKKMIVAVPWFLPGKTDKERDLDWFYAMSYDATKVLGKAISNEIEVSKKSKKELTREGVQNQFGQLKEIQGRTGKINFGGSERTNPPSKLIQLNCPTNDCKWDIVN
jgi:ABC-type branched-subunit amino acid transport system substrate-binding protein